jgi:hypothetical protein
MKFSGGTNFGPHSANYAIASERVVNGSGYMDGDQHDQ